VEGVEARDLHTQRKSGHGTQGGRNLCRRRTSNKVRRCRMDSTHLHPSPIHIHHPTTNPHIRIKATRGRMCRKVQGQGKISRRILGRVNNNNKEKRILHMSVRNVVPTLTSNKR
jgi:hypothetical protein